MNIILFCIFWYLIVPAISRRFTDERFRNSDTYAIADDSGWAELTFTQEKLPEGVVREKDRWRFSPRPIWKKTKEGKKEKPYDPELMSAENLVLRKFILKDLGKPFWFGYVGKVGLMNPATLAALQSESNPHNPKNPSIPLNKLEQYVASLPKSYGKGLDKMFSGLSNPYDPRKIKMDLETLVSEVKQSIETQPLTLIDPRKIKEVLPQMFTPSQMKALARNREERGMERAGKHYDKLIFGGLLIVGLLIFGIIAITYFMKQPQAQASSVQNATAFFGFAKQFLH